MTFVIAYDIGTTGVKTCLFSMEKGITLLGSTSQGYNLYILENGGAEQDGDEWWQAMAATTERLLCESGVSPAQISGLSFCSQMQGMVLVDRDGTPVHRPMSYMDQRSRQELKAGMAHGLQIAGANLFKLLRSLQITRAVSSSVKDPVWKYKWVEAHEPEAFRRAYKWLDVKEYLIARCTGRFVMTEDSAYATMLYDTRKGREGFSDAMCQMLRVRMEHLPEVVRSTDVVGGLTERAARELGLRAGTPVFGGGGDASLIGVGAGCVRTGDTHIYCGTSGWVSTVLDRQELDVGAMIAAIVGAQSGKFNYFAEMETAGKCLEWVRDHLALDEIGIYLQKTDVSEGHESVRRSLYDYLTETVRHSPPGAGGVIFTPWLHGNRCPFEDPNSTGMFFGIRLETGKTDLIRAVLEGICYHLRWMLEKQRKKVPTSDPIRFVGGGALSPVTCQILADVTGCTIETVASPQNVGSVGAAAVMGVGLGLISNLEAVRDFVPAVRSFPPDPENRAIYDRSYAVFLRLYRANRENFRLLHEAAEQSVRKETAAL
ncbi:MAG: FGGY-family carbohydrate kinase [Oscillospiraceae bacterium]|nr:FGGY-family carbohydrate kinase [Oscillospiraceae bacterium]